MVFFLGAYGSLPDAAIWWCLRTGGGGVLTSTHRPWQAAVQRRQLGSLRAASATVAVVEPRPPAGTSWWHDARRQWCGEQQGGRGAGGDNFYAMQPPTLIDHGGRRRPTASMWPHSWRQSKHQLACMLRKEHTALKLKKIQY